MFAVIFKAEFNKPDDEYSITAERMRELAKNQYGCLDFISVCEGNMEISISYWENQEQIGRWKQDPEHKKAQEKGKSIWYKSYTIEIVEVVHSYRKNT